MGIKKIEGQFTKSDVTIGIVVSRWNAFITEKLLDGAVDVLKRHGVDEDRIIAAYCPGAYEIPMTARKLLDSGKVDGVLTLGAVIRGATPHFDYVCNAVNRGVSELNMKSDKPVTFGVLTTDTIEQAIERAGTKAGNKGADAALALLEMLSLIEQIDAL